MCTIKLTRYFLMAFLVSHNNILTLWNASQIIYSVIYIISFDLHLLRLYSTWIKIKNLEYLSCFQACLYQSWIFFHSTIYNQSLEKVMVGRSQDGGGVGRGEHFLPHKFIKRAFKHRVNSIKQLLNAGRGHQAPRKATQPFERR